MPEDDVRATAPARNVEELETLIAQRPSLAPPPEDFGGALVGQRYRVHQQLGKGGTAAVYLAEDQTLGRQVALKILSPDLARSARWVHRFRREARAVARLEHPNIVKIYDYGETATGLLYFVMEYVRGNSLAQLLSERAEDGGGGLPILQVRHVALQICRAIHAAHDERIIHRDLKPGNIMIVPQGDGVGLVKVLDFGIAKLAEDEADPGDTPSRLTGIGQTIGTPEYMAPEQVLGELLDHRSDVYALGCILYELLTGDVPFSAEPRERVRYKHVFEAPLRPQERRPDVPPALEAICLRALEKSPERRFQSMAEMELAIEREMDGGLDALLVSAPPALPADGLGLAALQPPERPPRRERATPTPRPTVLERSRPPVSSQRVEESWFDALSTPLPAPVPARDSLEGGLISMETSAPVIAVAPVEPSAPIRVTPAALPVASDDDGPAAEPRPRRRVWLWFALGGATALCAALLLLLAQGGPVRQAQGRAEHAPQAPAGAALTRETPAPAALTREALAPAASPPVAPAAPVTQVAAPAAAPVVPAVARRLDPPAAAPPRPVTSARLPRPAAEAPRPAAPRRPTAPPIELPLPSDIPLSSPSS